MKNLIHYLAITFILFASSCSKDEELPSQQSAADLVANIKKVADEKWIAIQSEISNPTANLDQVAESKGGDLCNCSYTIESVNYTLPQGKTDVEMGLYSSIECVINHPESCNYFSGVGFSGPVCGGCIFEGCCDEWTSLPPTGTFSFNCSLPVFSSFPVVGYGIWVDEGCGGGDLINWKITYKITCASNTSPECTYTTPPITYSASAPTNLLTGIISLQDCGCKPVIIEEPPCDTSQCGGEFNGTYSGYGYYKYPSIDLCLCPGTVNVYGDPYGLPNKYTLKCDGNIIHSQWVGDSQTYPIGPWAGQNIPYYYNHTFTAQSGKVYTLEVETVTPQYMTDSWTASVGCGG